MHDPYEWNENPHDWDYSHSRLTFTPKRTCTRCGETEVMWDDEDFPINECPVPA